jgi:transcriptional regulator with XRE-family HTH domain
MIAQKIVGRNVRKFREATKISQESLADKCGLDRTYISSVENGKRNISINNVFKIAVALKVEPHTLLIRNLKHKAA